MKTKKIPPSIQNSNFVDEYLQKKKEREDFNKRYKEAMEMLQELELKIKKGIIKVV